MLSARLPPDSRNPGLWDWLQNFYHCGSGNPLWNLYKLATWGHILDISADSEVDGKGVSPS